MYTLVTFGLTNSKILFAATVIRVFGIRTVFRVRRTKAGYISFCPWTINRALYVLQSIYGCLMWMA